MNEKLSSQLSFLINGLCGAPTKTDLNGLIKSVEDMNGPFAPEIKQAVGALQSSLPSGKLTELDFQKASKKLSSSRNPNIKQAGRALSWALNYL